MSTAIHRKGPSAPVRRLAETYLDSWYINHQTVLDYGCGHGADVDFLQKHSPTTEVVGWDPVHRPGKAAFGRKYETILCTYVLNVLPTREEVVNVIKSIQALLTDTGWAYITVRRDLKLSECGKTSRGHQHWIALFNEDMTELQSETVWKRFTTYRITKHHNIEVVTSHGRTDNA